nr:hypothetical protein [Tanacetum cinerariifolium]
MLPRPNYDVVTTLNYVVVQMKISRKLRKNYGVVARFNYAVVTIKYKRCMSSHNYGVVGHFNYVVVTLSLQKESLTQHNYDVVYTINYAIVGMNIINAALILAYSYHSLRGEFQRTSRASKEISILPVAFGSIDASVDLVRPYSRLNVE